MGNNQVTTEINENKSANPYIIRISEDKMYAYITFVQNINLDKEIIANMLSSKNIVFGINYDVIDKILTNMELNKDYIIATGKEPIHGKDGYVEYFFKTSKDFEPEVDEAGNINFKSLHIVNNVSEGDKLALIYFPTNGVDGTDIFGKPAKGRRGLNPIITFDDASVEKLEDGTLISKVAGAARLSKGKVIVENQFVVQGDVGPASGNIEFNGNVIVTGNVLTDYEIRATGDVEVKGSVEGGSIYAKGNLIVHKGIIGMDKGIVDVEGFVQSKYIQSCHVRCGEDITAESLLYCDIKCKKTITVKGRKGVMNGGVYKAATMIQVKQLGSHMCTKTTVEVGIDPDLIEQYRHLKEEIRVANEQIEKLDTIIAALSKVKESLSPEKKQMFVNALNSKDQIKDKLHTDNYDYHVIEELIAKASGGTVIVTGMAYQGVKIQISECSYYVNNEMKGMKFTKRRGDIVSEGI